MIFSPISLLLFWGVVFGLAVVSRTYIRPLDRFKFLTLILFAFFLLVLVITLYGVVKTS